MVNKHNSLRLPRSFSIISTPHSSFSASRTTTAPSVNNQRHGRDRHTSPQTSNRTSTTKYRRLPFSTFCHPKKGWGLATSTQPSQPASVSSSLTLQNGNYDNHPPSTSAQGLFNINRSARRILPHFDPSCLSTSTSIPMATANLPVSCPSFRTKSLPTDVHENLETTPTVGSSERDSDICLLGRPDQHGQVRTTIAGAYRTGVSKNDRNRMVDQLEEILTNTFSTDNTPRQEYRHQDNVSLYPWQEDPLYSPSGIPSHEENVNVMNIPGSICGNSTSDLPRQSASTISDKVYGLTIQPISTTTMFSNTQHQERTYMVDQSTDEMEWSTYTFTPTDHTGLYGCFQSRMGHCLESVLSARKMEPSRT